MDEHRLWLVLNNSLSQPKFYVQASSLVEAAELAQKIVITIRPNGEVLQISEWPIKLLTMEYREGVQ
jgi:hypothetical protein